ncbi:hypothetical protein KEM56_000331, partial [Ascosphaera pollenicola]
MSRSPGRDMGAPPSRSPRPLAPRPSFDAALRRQRTLSEASNSSLKVSLPPGIRPRNPNRASQSAFPPSPKSNSNKCESHITNGMNMDPGGLLPPRFPPLPMGDLLSSYPASYHSSMWPPPSPGATNSLHPMGRKLSASALSMKSTSSVASNGTASTSVTPEKQRLMKALQHRKKMQEEEDRRERSKVKTTADGDILKAENQETYTHYVAPQRTETGLVSSSSSKYGSIIFDKPHLIMRAKRVNEAVAVEKMVTGQDFCFERPKLHEAPPAEHAETPLDTSATGLSATITLTARPNHVAHSKVFYPRPKKDEPSPAVYLSRVSSSEICTNHHPTAPIDIEAHCISGHCVAELQSTEAYQRLGDFEHGPAKITGTQVAEPYDLKNPTPEDTDIANKSTAINHSTDQEKDQPNRSPARISLTPSDPIEPVVCHLDVSTFHLRPVSVSTCGTGDSLLADEVLMDEISSATVQEAHSVSLSNSTAPPASVIDHPPSSTPSSRPMSPHSTSGSDTPAPVSGKDPSDTHDHGPIERPTTSHSGQSLTAKKPAVSSGISKRIEALKMMSNTGGGSPG